MAKKVAVILSGAVAKGAYEAGVLQVLVQHDVEIVRFVGTSAGALNATIMASAIRAGDPVRGATTLVDLWGNHAGISDVFALQLGSLARLEGASGPDKVRALLQSGIARGPVRREISLRIVLTALRGVDSDRKEAQANIDMQQELIAANETPTPPLPMTRRTTYEVVQDFTAADFATDAALDRVVASALASAAFPFAFVPVEVEPFGPCIDGGAVNNTPIGWATGGEVGAQVEQVIIVSPVVERVVDPPKLRGLALFDQLANILLGERLYRDLRAVERTNDKLVRLRKLVADGVLSEDQLTTVLRALEWETTRPIEVIQIRPLAPLEGTAFSGFRHAGIRDEYIQVGRERAAAVLGIPYKS